MQPVDSEGLMNGEDQGIKGEDPHPAVPVLVVWKRLIERYGQFSEETCVEEKAVHGNG